MRTLCMAAAVALMMGVSSCSTSKTVLPYFTDIAEIQEGTLPDMDYVPVIQPDDMLNITVTSLNPEATIIYNTPAFNASNGSMTQISTNLNVLEYMVNANGDINFPILGTIHVGGMTTQQLQEYLEKRISADVEDPSVTVRLTNFTVVVTGEVNRPGRQSVNRERYSILDALAQAGDLTPYGERNNILLVREENGKRKYVRLNMNDSEVLTSPYFYLRQNDYIYVEPNKVREANAKYNTDNAYKLSLASTVVSGAAAIISLVIALVVK
ncbi:MAG: polysaccharide biosynthesis/export family protein [Muribaculaceae bacterium]|nr:polysaccharide biosynthesis/export family protein [Muribaculaceae bacterium]